MKRYVLTLVVISSAAVLSSCAVTTTPVYGPNYTSAPYSTGYSGYTVGYGYGGDNDVDGYYGYGGYGGYNGYGGWASTYYSPGVRYGSYRSAYVGRSAGFVGRGGGYRR